MIPTVESIAVVAVVYMAVYFVVVFVLLLVSLREMFWYARGQLPGRGRMQLGDSPSVTLIVPAYNEETLIVQNATAFLAVDYPALDILIVNDGSTDGTLDRLREAFDLVPLPLHGRLALETAPVRGGYVSRTAPALRVADKENGGRSDAVNTGLSVARGELVVVVDADSFLEPDAITRAVRRFEVHPDTCVAVGGAIRIANGSTIVAGRVDVPRVSMQGLAATQILEYLRGFLGARIAWSELNGLLIVSGAFGVFRRDVLVALGGLSTQTLGEDMELTMRLHRQLRASWKGARVEFAPDAVCWTEAPSGIAGLRSQRIRWHVGLIDNLRLHWPLFGRARFGAAGLLAMPYVVVFEAIAPLVELAGYVAVVALLIRDPADWPYGLTFFFVTSVCGMVLNAAALLITEVGFHRYTGRDTASLLFWGFVESLWYRPMNAWWRTKATFLALAGRRPGWGTIPRGEGILEQHPAETFVPLTR